MARSFVRPAATRFDTRIEQTATRYSVHNAGNSTVMLDHFRDCSAKDERDCEATRLHHVLPGKHYAFDKVPGRVYRFNLTQGGEHRPIHVE